MPAPIRRTDELGFPIPGTFDEAPDAASAAGRKVRGLLWRWRWVLLILLLPLLFYDKLGALAGHWIAERAFAKAEDNLRYQNLTEALAQADRAIYWEPNGLERAKAHWLRGKIYEQTSDLSKSVADFTRAIELSSRPGQPSEERVIVLLAYYGRASVRERLGQHHDAIDDTTAALKLAGPWDRAQALNERAYIRALAGLELEQGMDDITQALSAIQRAGDDTLETEAQFLDTRGYLQLRLTKYQEALKDFNQAIADWSRLRVSLLRANGAEWDHRELKALMQEYNQNLAVMRHHRGEAYQKLGKDKEMRDDFDWAERNGYNPAKGVL